MGFQDGAKSGALLAAPGVLDPTDFMLALTYCFSLLGGAASIKMTAKTSTCWGYVGTFFALERLFFALGRLFCICGRSWLVLALFLTSWSALGSILEAPKPYFSMFFRTMAFVLPSKCMNCCRKPQLAFESAFRSPLRRGGTCAAHGIGLKIDFSCCAAPP